MGMLLLYAGILENPIRAYNWKKYEIDQGMIDGYLKKFGDIYSPQLLALIASMVEMNELKRPTFTQLQEYMNVNMPFYQRGRGSPVKPYPSERQYDNFGYGSVNQGYGQTNSIANNGSHLGSGVQYNQTQKVFPSVPMINSTYVPQNQSMRYH